MIEKQGELSKLFPSNANIMSEVKAPIWVHTFRKILRFRRISNFFTENTDLMEKFLAF